MNTIPPFSILILFQKPVLTLRQITRVSVARDSRRLRTTMIFTWDKRRISIDKNSTEMNITN